MDRFGMLGQQQAWILTPPREPELQRPSANPQITGPAGVQKTLNRSNDLSHDMNAWKIFSSNVSDPQTKRHVRYQ
eukprot:747219-Hanusia_phi.AAC.10